MWPILLQCSHHGLAFLCQTSLWEDVASQAVKADPFMVGVVNVTSEVVDRLVVIPIPYLVI